MMMVSQGILCLALLRITAAAHDAGSEQQGHGVAMDVDQAFTLTMVSDTAAQETAADDYNATAGEEDENALSEEALYYGLDLGVPQTLFDDFEEGSVSAIVEARKYMQAEVWVEDAPEKSCENLHESCAYWAAVGACEENVDFMAVNCAPLCWSCHYSPQHGLTPPRFNDENCPVDYDENAWQAGDLDKMFERIVTDPVYASLEPRVLSRPTLAPGDDLETADYVVGGPWMVVFDSAVTEEEADRLVEMGATEGYERSLDVTETYADGTLKKDITAGRTSTNAWCTGPCAEDASAQNVASRMEHITGIPEAHAEHLQLLRYTEGQFYQVHHDFIPAQVDQPVGPRILTFYIYLSDVEEGGGTNFPHIDPSNPDFTVMPKKGRAVLWPSVLNEQPDVQDDRTLHQALPVTKGQKFGANAWIHLRDWKTNGEKGCTYS